MRRTSSTLADNPWSATIRYGARHGRRSPRAGCVLEARRALRNPRRLSRRAGSGAPATSAPVRLARRLWDSEQYFQAINEWQAIKNLAPTDVDARMSLARAYEKIGERSTAYNEYRAILDLAPAHPGAIQALARFR